MTRRVPPALRTWSGALLVCALMLCLSGLARPAMAAAMPMTMPGPMESASSAAAEAGHTAMVTDSAGGGPQCPMVQEQCAAPKATVVQDGPTAPALGDAPQTTPCSTVDLLSQPNAPPPPLPPPDLHRLCVSRT
ncbi:hypothetical protein [Streptomyces sp. ISL-100]|uniref:hypothetical protein n=1 Tax=Streptomyces sp. ISL-100 TaxID=2819173 RepID=UPI001BEA64A7|nr:hypothetical protein [Streptomyces sp. ISL-100]MBT2395999.1 hypothetical protein [Streptomyces sp. ISL-100]